MPCGGEDACLTEVNVDPRGVGTLRVDIKAGDPLLGLFHEHKRGHEETCRAQKARGNKRGRQWST
jgi:hypothetical protein